MEFPCPGSVEWGEAAASGLKISKARRSSDVQAGVAGADPGILGRKRRNGGAGAGTEERLLKHWDGSLEGKMMMARPGQQGQRARSKCFAAGV